MYIKLYIQINFDNIVQINLSYKANTITDDYIYSLTITPCPLHPEKQIASYLNV